MGNSFEKKRIEIFSRFAEAIKHNLDLAVQEGSIPPTDTSIVAYIWLGAINEVIIRWLYTGKPSPVKEALPVLRQVLLRGVGVKVNSTGMSADVGEPVS